MKNFWVTILTLALVGCSTQQGSLAPSSEQNGFVQGRILATDGSGRANQYVVVEGLNLAAITDSTGRFSLELPAGNYRLVLPDTLLEVSVESSKTSTIPDRILAGLASKSRSYALLRVEVHFTRDGEEAVWVGGAGDLDLWRPVRINADSLYLRCVVGEAKLGATGEAVYVPLEIPSSITRNGDSIVSMLPPKGRLVTPTLEATGLDTFVITVDTTVCARFIVVDSQHVKAFTRDQVLITTERIVLIPKYNDDLWGSYASGKWMVVGSDTFWVNYDRLSGIDWDLYLVNEEAGDTCYWRNSNPDWGVTGAGEDDPAFSGDAWGIGWDGASPGRFYSADRITFDNPPAGVYSIYVTCFDGVSDTAGALPRLGLEIGVNPESSKIEKFYQNSPSRPLMKGEVWYAGTITFPGGVYSPRDQRILSGSTGDLTKVRLAN